MQASAPSQGEVYKVQGGLSVYATTETSLDTRLSLLRLILLLLVRRRINARHVIEIGLDDTQDHTLRIKYVIVPLLRQVTRKSINALFGPLRDHDVQLADRVDNLPIA